MKLFVDGPFEVRQVRERRVDGSSCLSLRRSAEARGFKKMAPGFANLSSEAQKFGHPVVGLRIPNWIAHGGISLIVSPTCSRSAETSRAQPRNKPSFSEASTTMTRSARH
jgi:hypothetical protein